MIEADEKSINVQRSINHIDISEVPEVDRHYILERITKLVEEWFTSGIEYVSNKS